MAQFLKYLEQVASGVFNRDAASEVSESIPGLMVNDADWSAWENAVSQWDPEPAQPPASRISTQATPLERLR